MYSDLLTPAQNRLFNDPRLTELIKRFDLVPLKTPAVIRNEMISNRVNEMLTQFSDPSYIQPPRLIKYTVNGVVHESPF